MSLQELEKLGSLIDEADWSAENHRSNVAAGCVVPAIVLGVTGCWALGVGNGGWLTWAGVVAFAVGLFTFIVVNVRAISTRE